MSQSTQYESKPNYNTPPNGSPPQDGDDDPEGEDPFYGDPKQVWKDQWLQSHSRASQDHKHNLINRTSTVPPTRLSKR